MQGRGYWHEYKLVTIRKKNLLDCKASFGYIICFVLKKIISEGEKWGEQNCKTPTVALCLAHSVLCWIKTVVISTAGAKFSFVIWQGT